VIYAEGLPAIVVADTDDADNAAERAQISRIYWASADRH
jgi:hypothetical protein